MAHWESVGILYPIYRVIVCAQRSFKVLRGAPTERGAKGLPSINRRRVGPRRFTHYQTCSDEAHGPPDGAIDRHRTLVTGNVFPNGAFIRLIPAYRPGCSRAGLGAFFEGRDRSAQAEAGIAPAYALGLFVRFAVEADLIAGGPVAGPARSGALTGAHRCLG